MIDLSKIENATIWELQSQLEFYQRDLNHAKSWLENIERDTSILKAALCVKINGDHKFEDGRCKCGASLLTKREESNGS